MANDKRMLSICCWKFFLVSCEQRLEVCDCTISELIREEKLLIPHYLYYFCSRQKKAFLQGFMKKRRDLHLQKSQSNDPDTKYSQTHTPCNITWSQVGTSGEFSLNI